MGIRKKRAINEEKPKDLSLNELETLAKLTRLFKNPDHADQAFALAKTMDLYDDLLELIFIYIYHRVVLMLAPFVI